MPDRLLRPGAVVLESDDAGPELADLDYADYGDFADYGDYAEYDDYVYDDYVYGDVPDRADHIRAV